MRLGENIDARSVSTRPFFLVARCFENSNSSIVPLAYLKPTNGPLPPRDRRLVQFDALAVLRRSARGRKWRRDASEASTNSHSLPPLPLSCDAFFLSFDRCSSRSSRADCVCRDPASVVRCESSISYSARASISFFLEAHRLPSLSCLSL